MTFTTDIDGCSLSNKEPGKDDRLYRHTPIGLRLNRSNCAIISATLCICKTFSQPGQAEWILHKFIRLRF